MAETLFHIVGRDEWQRAIAAGVHRPDSLALQGFIHLSTQAQVLRTAAKWFAGRDDLLVLVIPRDGLTGEVRYEPVGDDRFPHLYGPLDPRAVTDVVELLRDANGAFTLARPI